MGDKNFTFNFNAPVGQNIANVEHMDVHLDKDGQIQVMNAEQVSTAFTPKDKRGPKFQVLFADENGDENSERTHIEKERLLSYLRDNDLLSQRLSSSKHDELTQTVICFCKKWVELKYVSTSFSPTALTRFLTDTCGIEKKVDQVSVANVLKPLLASGRYDKHIYDQVCEYF